MKKLLTMALSSVMALMMLAGCGGEEAPTGDDTGDTTPPVTDNQGAEDGGTEDNSLQAIKDKGVLILGLDDEFPPMGFRDNDNEIVGFDIDLARAVAENLGVELELKPISWEAKELELESGNIDCIWNGMSITPQRVETMSISIPYMENTMALVVLADSGIASQADMAGKTLALQSGSSAEEVLNSEDSTEFRETLTKVNGFDSYLSAILELETGGSDAVLMDSVVANYLITSGGKDFVVLEDVLYSEEYGIGFRKNDVALTEAVNQALKDLVADGTVGTISTEWFGTEATIIE